MNDSILNEINYFNDFVFTLTLLSSLKSTPNMGAAILVNLPHQRKKNFSCVQFNV